MLHSHKGKNCVRFFYKNLPKDHHNIFLFGGSHVLCSNLFTLKLLKLIVLSQFNYLCLKADTFTLAVNVEM